MKYKKTIGSIMITLGAGLIYLGVIQPVLAGYTLLRLDDPNQVSPYATSTPTASKIPIADGSGKLDDGWLNITDAQVTDLTDGGTTTLHSHAGGLLHSFTSNVTVTPSSAETALISFTLPANSLSTGNIVKIKIYAQTQQATNSNDLILRLKYGSTTVASDTQGNNNGSKDYITAMLVGAGTTNSQEGSFHFLLNGGAGNDVLSDEGTATEDSTGDLTVQVTAQFSNSNVTNAIIAYHGYAELIKL